VIYAVYRLGLHGEPLPISLEGPNPATYEVPTPSASAAAAASIASLCPVCNVNEGAAPATAGGNRACCRSCFARLESEGAFGGNDLRGAFSAVILNAFASARDPPPPSAAAAPDSDSDDA